MKCEELGCNKDVCKSNFIVYQKCNEHQFEGVCIEIKHLKRIAEYYEFPVANMIGVSQKVIWKAMLKYDIKTRIAKKRNQWAEKNTSWKGKKASYSAFHFRVERVRGKPKICEICNTTIAKKYEWASISKKYYDVYDYKRMCSSCHAKFDRKILNITGVNADA